MFLEVMQGKMPKSVITDGASAIRRVFTQHHRVTTHTMHEPIEDAVVGTSLVLQLYRWSFDDNKI
jgi:hypothetical protein